MNTSFSLSDLDPRKWSLRTWLLFIVALIALVLLLAGCTQHPDDGAEPTETAIAESGTAVSTDTPTLASTDTPEPTETPSSTPTSTAVPSPTFTPEPEQTATPEWECTLDGYDHCGDIGEITVPEEAEPQITGANAYIALPDQDLMVSGVVIPEETQVAVYWRLNGYFGISFNYQNFWVSEDYLTLVNGNEIPTAESYSFWTAETETAEVAASPLATTEGTPESTAVAGPTLTPTPGPCSGFVVGQDDGSMRDDSILRVNYHGSGNDKTADVTFAVDFEWQMCLNERMLTGVFTTTDDGVLVSFNRSLNWVPDVASHGIWLLDSNGRVRAATSIWLGD